MLARTPDPLDVMVGARIRIFRTHRGLSQSDLAGKIGVTFQQVQKYEKGPTAQAPAGYRVSRRRWVSRSANCSSLPRTSLPTRNLPFDFLPIRMPCGFSRPFRGRPIRACDVLSLGWSKASPMNRLP